MTGDEILELVAALRGGVPERCDFCAQPFTDKRTPAPEEAGLWSCSECLKRWDKLDKVERARDGN